MSNFSQEEGTPHICNNIPKFFTSFFLLLDAYIYIIFILVWRQNYSNGSVHEASFNSQLHFQSCVQSYRSIGANLFSYLVLLNLYLCHFYVIIILTPAGKMSNQLLCWLCTMIMNNISTQYLSTCF